MITKPDDGDVAETDGFVVADEGNDEAPFGVGTTPLATDRCCLEST
jgi:hypothetical protein